ncbi:hypothetical protein JHK87_018379 [Glycine soja]|nr:hypothetical protein JHK87_018379 [Glycine soja]
MKLEQVKATYFTRPDSRKKSDDNKYKNNGGLQGAHTRCKVQQSHAYKGSASRVRNGGGDGDMVILTGVAAAETTASVGTHGYTGHHGSGGGGCGGGGCGGGGCGGGGC